MAANRLGPVTGQSHENDPACLVIVCAPSALSKMMGSLHPAGALYEKPVNIRSARLAHASFVNMLRRKGATVYDVRAILTNRVDWSVGDRIALENLAFSCLTYIYHGREGGALKVCESVGGLRGTGDNVAEFYVSDTYKRHVIEEMGTQQLVDIIFTHPTVTVSPSTRDTGFTASYQFDPLSNIAFVRDQQITTRRGIIMARLRSPQRVREVDIMEFCFRKLGLNVVGRIPAPGFLEGGDFFPAGKELSLIGVGTRSDVNAVHYLLENDLLDTQTVAVVKDLFERKQERMHLDTVFSILSEDCCVMMKDMMGEDSKTRRLVDEYIYAPVNNKEEEENERVAERVGKYVLSRKDVEFSSFMRERGYNIIEISGEEQLNYGCNVLNMGAGRIISIEKETARRIACSPHFQGTVEYLDFSAVTCMYGGVHCASQVVGRCMELSDLGNLRLPRMDAAEEGMPSTTFTDDRANDDSDTS
eukprot:GFKZ01010355.1.p1 GENE.GFKZ01010355.1~~GFKZ01010355.1.p1  ORF type:complete len:474 (+),score=74.17 GFKZ01010355.1:170-1591(+)